MPYMGSHWAGRVGARGICAARYGFGEAAMRSAIAPFRFSPPRLQGRPVSTWWVYTVTYVLHKSK
jgi:hypothetical protein